VPRVSLEEEEEGRRRAGAGGGGMIWTSEWYRNNGMK